ncbi:hypothetical protein AB1Y20_008179 [Prymnesium parvum]|uniref:Ribosome-binding factor A n=1 Tax=Prymnesium parvum TaxID=97485 RepID=A0AB34IWC0_PRYPA
MRTLPLLLSLLSSLAAASLRRPAPPLHASVAPRHASPALRAEHAASRRPSRVSQVVRAELAAIFASGHVRGARTIPAGLNTMISIVDIDMSPDLRNARVKVSVIGERKDKISAVRWLQGNSKSIRYEMAQRLRQMKRIPQLSFQHVDVGAAVDIMVKLERLSEERRWVERQRGELADGEELDFEADDEDAFFFDDDEDVFGADGDEED